MYNESSFVSRMKILISLLIFGLIEVTRADVCNVHPASVNLGLFGRTCQSSTFPGAPRPGPERAVDGVSETNHTMFTCAITNLEPEPWWSVDLEESYFIGVVYIVTRQDSCWDCLEGAELRVGNSPDYKNPVCAVIKNISRSKPILQFFCNGMQGRYVTIIHAGRSGIISLCECKIYQYIPGEKQPESLE
ncbi:fucolectin-1-like [Pyxicephalus adspersus]|uniref:fucolectin-1-like n=1 Tax=Pyxicephalus adspersus TaxID=30357 RepID=UPI003B5B9201